MNDIPIYFRPEQVFEAMGWRLERSTLTVVSIPFHDKSDKYALLAGEILESMRKRLGDPSTWTYTSAWINEWNEMVNTMDDIEWRNQNEHKFAYQSQ